MDRTLQIEKACAEIDAKAGITYDDRNHIRDSVRQKRDKFIPSTAKKYGVKESTLRMILK